ncbi:MAG: hypothetical protein CMN57_09745 [Gammaproteobacteria bacterium]|nr:hypothetical protein [Gammaproteobacteria bacterium]|tara:strand:+ start:30375 stop:30812 length:438 start_codon:yes stop_codon:yes gene_type:complete
MFGAPEADIAVTAFLLHLVWEFWQAPWYQGMSDMPHLQGILLCSRAAFGDAFIALLAYGTLAAYTRDRYWAAKASPSQVAGYVGVGLAVTIVLEWLATAVLDRWQYAASMPTVPLLGTGLAPLLQWLIVPLAVLGWIRRVWNLRR